MVKLNKNIQINSFSVTLRNKNLFSGINILALYLFDRNLKLVERI